MYIARPAHPAIQCEKIVTPPASSAALCMLHHCLGCSFRFTTESELQRWLYNQIPLSMALYGFQRLNFLDEILWDSPWWWNHLVKISSIFPSCPWPFGTQVPGRPGLGRGRPREENCSSDFCREERRKGELVPQPMKPLRCFFPRMHREGFLVSW